MSWQWNKAFKFSLRFDHFRFAWWLIERLQLGSQLAITQTQNKAMLGRRQELEDHFTYSKTRRCKLHCLLILSSFTSSPSSSMGSAIDVIARKTHTNPTTNNRRRKKKKKIGETFSVVDTKSLKAVDSESRLAFPCFILSSHCYWETGVKLLLIPVQTPWLWPSFGFLSRLRFSCPCACELILFSLVIYSWSK